MNLEGNFLDECIETLGKYVSTKEEISQFNNLDLSKLNIEQMNSLSELYKTKGELEGKLRLKESYSESEKGIDRLNKKGVSNLTNEEIERLTKLYKLSYGLRKELE